ncbi:MAG TPA: hypothetical protein VFU73_14455 [Actinocrinis sp.]|nr:hypothetical protein [Actinocrinis sp.]
MGDPYSVLPGYSLHGLLGALVTDPRLPGPWWPPQVAPDAELLRRVIEGLRRL